MFSWQNGKVIDRAALRLVNVDGCQVGALFFQENCLLIELRSGDRIRRRTELKLSECTGELVHAK